MPGTKIFSTSECAWAQVSMKILTRTITGLRGFEFKHSIEKELLYAAGGKPIDLMEGNEKVEGNIKLLKFEVDLMNDAALLAGFANIAKVPHTLINLTCQFKRTATSKARIIEIPSLGFTEAGYAMEQNAKMMEITLPFLALDMILI